MITHSKNKKVLHDSVQLQFCNDDLPDVDISKYLGVYTDKHLSRSNYISEVYRKLKPVIGVIAKQDI